MTETTQRHLRRIAFVGNIFLILSAYDADARTLPATAYIMWLLLASMTCLAAASDVELTRWQRRVGWLLAGSSVVAVIGMLRGSVDVLYLIAAMLVGAGSILWSIAARMSATVRWFGISTAVVYLLQGVSTALLRLPGQAWNDLGHVMQSIILRVNGTSTETVAVLCILTLLLMLIESSDVIIDARLRWSAPFIVITELSVLWWGTASHILQVVTAVVMLGSIVYLGMRVIAALPSILHRSSGTIVPLGAWTLGALIVLPSIDILRSTLGNLGPSPVASLYTAVVPGLDVLRSHAGSTMAITGLLAAAERWLGWDLKLRLVGVLLGVLSCVLIANVVAAYLPMSSAAHDITQYLAWCELAIYAALLVPVAKATMFSTAP